MDIKDEIRSRLPIEQLVGQYCQLKKKGRNFVCLCPFHNDSRPSFLVSPDKGIGYCFACQSGGDVFSFIQKIENISFPEAVKMLAEKAGVELPKDAYHREPSVSKDEKTRIKECLEEAQSWYLRKLSEHHSSSEYVAGRGVSPELRKKFGIGYAPDSFSETYDHLLKAGFGPSEILGAGLAIKKDLDGKPYDRFRHRVMFPIRDPQGTIIGFGGRAMGDSDAKYVNSPEGPLYNKSSVLFGFFEAREAIRKSRTVVLVEGYFDAVACHKAGVENVVAVSGTALTEQHVRILKRSADTVILCLDQDSAGQLAAGRAFDLLSREGLSILSVTMPAKDPDELIQKDPVLFRTLIQENAEPFIDVIIKRLGMEKNIMEPVGKRKVAATLFPLLDALPTSVELRAYLEKSAQTFGIVPLDLQSDFSRWKTSVNVSQKSIENSSDAVTSDAARYSGAELCLGIALTQPLTRSTLSDLIPPDDSVLASLRLSLLESGTDLRGEEILSRLECEDDRRQEFHVLSLYCEESFPHWSESMAIKEMRKLCAVSNKEVVMKKQADIVSALKEARTARRPDEEAKLLSQYQKLLKLTQMAGK